MFRLENKSDRNTFRAINYRSPVSPDTMLLETDGHSSDNFRIEHCDDSIHIVNTLYRRAIASRAIGEYTDESAEEKCGWKK